MKSTTNNNSVISNTISSINKDVKPFVERLTKKDLLRFFESRELYFNTYTNKLSTENVLGETMLLTTGERVFTPKYFNRETINCINNDSDILNIFDKEELVDMFLQKTIGFQKKVMDFVSLNKQAKSQGQKILKQNIDGESSAFWRTNGYPSLEFVEKYGGIDQTTEMVLSKMKTSKGGFKKNINYDFIIDYFKFLKENYNNKHLFEKVLSTFFAVYGNDYFKKDLTDYKYTYNNNKLLLVIKELFLTEESYNYYLDLLLKKKGDEQVEIEDKDLVAIFVIILHEILHKEKSDNSCRLRSIAIDLLLEQKFPSNRPLEKNIKIKLFSIYVLEGFEVIINLSDLINDFKENTPVFNLISKEEFISKTNNNRTLVYYGYVFNPLHLNFSISLLRKIKEVVKKPIFVIDTEETKIFLNKYINVLEASDIIEYNVYNFLDSEMFLKQKEIQGEFVKERLDEIKSLIKFDL